MKKLIPAALIALSATASALAPALAHSAPPAAAPRTPLTQAEQAMLRQVTQPQYQALIYITSECGFDPSPQLAVVLLKAPGFTAVADAMANLDLTPPELDAKRCAAFVGG